jgi:hypothetical protein
MLTNTEYKRLAASQGLTLVTLSEMVLGAGAYWSDEALIRGVRQLLLNQVPPLPKAPKRVSLPGDLKTATEWKIKADEAKQKFDDLADQVIEEIGKWNPRSQPWDEAEEERCHCDLCCGLREDNL